MQRAGVGYGLDASRGRAPSYCCLFRGILRSTFDFHLALYARRIALDNSIPSISGGACRRGELVLPIETTLLVDRATWEGVFRDASKAHTLTFHFTEIIL